MKTRPSLFFTLLFIFFLEITIAPSVNAVIKILPLGNSITQGISSGEPESENQVSYRWELWDLLDTNGYDVDFVGTLNNGSAVFGNLELADHEGHPGWTADEIVNGAEWDYPDKGKLEDWLITEQPDIVLLHIGTNDLFWEMQDPDDVALEVSQILDEIDRYSVDIPVILALIINQWYYACGSDSTTTTFNNLVYNMALDRIDLGDRIEIVDMECGADIDYRDQFVGGDMWDPLHPFETGYEKMADVWFTGIFAITHPVADAGPDQSVEKGDTVTLDASNSVDPDGMIDSYFWEQMPGGAQVVLSDPEVVNPTFTAPDVGLGIETLTFQVTVTDDDGLESTDTTYVYVSLSDELAIDMGSTGLWHYDGSWESITAWNVEGIEQWNDTLAIDMGSIGLWEYDGTNWTGITGVNVDVCVEWSQGLAIDMGSLGLWNYDGTNWTGITGVNVEGIAKWGNSLVIDMGSIGLWNYDGTNWTGITGVNVDGCVAWSQGLAIDMGSIGLWNYDGTNWTGITGVNVEGMARWGNNLVIDMGGIGLWEYDGTNWTGITGVNVDGCMEWTDGLAIDMGSIGLWNYDGTNWTGITGVNVDGCVEWSDGLAIDMGSIGLWNYDGTNWTGITGVNVDECEAVDLY